MRTRLLLLLLPLLALLLIAFGTLVAQSYATGLTQQRFAESLHDVESLAVRADLALRDQVVKPRLVTLLNNFHSVHPNAEVRIVDPDEATVAVRGHAAGAGNEIYRATQAALAGQSPAPPATAWPWRQAPFVVGVPVGHDSAIVGAVVLIAPTDEVRQAIVERVVLLTGAGMAVLLLATFLFVLPLARWVLRPVADLADAAKRISAGESDARAFEDGGPPELRGLATAFNRMAVSVASALARQRAFAADASHQLRNPLTALRLRMDNLALHVAPAGEHELRAALQDADQLALTIDVLLLLARAEVTAAELRSVDVAQTAAARIDMWRPVLAEARIMVQISSPGASYAQCHPDALEQALDALLDNARKFGGATAIDITISPQHGELRVRVRDHGPGLSGDERACAAERFWRSPRHQNLDGTGLGLTIARALLEAGGARLELHDAAPGLAADIILPTSNAGAASAQIAFRPQRPASV